MRGLVRGENECLSLVRVPFIEEAQLPAIAWQNQTVSYL